MPFEDLSIAITDLYNSECKVELRRFHSHNPEDHKLEPTPELYHLWKVRLWNSETRQHMPEQFVLAPSGADAVSQASCLYQMDQNKHMCYVPCVTDTVRYTVFMELSIAVRVPMMIRGWSGNQF